MRVRNELRKQQKAITIDLKARAQKAEKLLGDIEACEKQIAVLDSELSAVLGGETGVNEKARSPKRRKQRRKQPGKRKAVKIDAAKVADAPKVAKAAKAKRKGGRPSSQKASVRDFLIRAGRPMKIAEIVQGMRKAGHVFTAKNPIRATEKMLYKYSKVFKKVGPGTFTAG